MGFVRSCARWYNAKDFYPNIGILIIILTVAIYSNDIRYWQRNDRIIAGDILHYYAYLPATFIYHDLELKFVSQNPSDYLTKFWPFRSPIKKNTIMTTMGMSVLYAPAFLTTRAIMWVIGDESDGFSPPYNLGLVIGSIIYLMISLVLLKKVLLRYFSPVATTISLIMVALGTNLGHYSTHEPTMSHLYGFFLFSVFLYLVVRWHENPTLKYSIFIGLVSGMIALVRPSNILIGFIFVFWNISGIVTLKQKVLLFSKNYAYLLVIILFAVLIWVPQMLYWKHIAGSYLFYSYGEESKFFFNNPQIFNNLFSYRKGWLVYTPIMITAFLGMIILWKKKPGLVVPMVIFSVVNIYVISSWWSWWYGGGFGLRAYVESYAIYSLGFAAFVQWIVGLRYYFIKIPLYIIIALFIALNLFQTRQYYFGSIHFVGMTKEAYWHQFLKLKPYGEYYYLLTIPDMQKARQGIYVFEPTPRND
jgi:hypothetical protein